MITLYDLAGADDRRFSPNTWRSRLALEHKGLEYAARGFGFGDIPTLCGGKYKTVPIITDGKTEVCGSEAIVDYLEETYDTAPSLFGDWGQRSIRFFENWCAAQVMAPLAPMIMLDIYKHLKPEDQAYFRESREKRFGKSLEDLAEGREDGLPALTKALHPARMMVRDGGYLGGGKPNYADYVLIGQFQWARCCSEFQVLGEDDKLWPWMQRMLDVYGGVLRDEPSYWG